MLDEEMRSFSVPLRIRGLPGVEAVDVAVVHAERRSDQDRVVNLEVGRAFSPCRVDVRARDALTVNRDLARDVQEGAKLRIDLGRIGIVLYVLDQLDPAVELESGEGAVRVLADTVLLRLET